MRKVQCGLPCPFSDLDTHSREEEWTRIGCLMPLWAISPWPRCLQESETTVGGMTHDNRVITGFIGACWQIDEDQVFKRSIGWHTHTHTYPYIPEYYRRVSMFNKYRPLTWVMAIPLLKLVGMQAKTANPSLRGGGCNGSDRIKGATNKGLNRSIDDSPDANHGISKMLLPVFKTRSQINSYLRYFFNILGCWSQQSHQHLQQHGYSLQKWAMNLL